MLRLINTKKRINALSKLTNFFLPSVSLQVSTSTGIISHFVNLQVVVPEAFILGSGELHVDMGSTINLVCIIEKVSVRDPNVTLLFFLP